MLKRPLGNTGIQVSVLGLGTVKLGRNQEVKYPQPFAIPDDKQAARLIAKAQELGINLLDTAPAYGNSEERLGALLKGRRNDWVICTKAGEEFVSGRSRYDFSPDAISASVERSLRHLQTDYLDIVLLHSDGSDMDIVEHSGAMEALQKMRDKGLVRAFGLSGKTSQGNLASVERADTAMVALSPDYQDEMPVIERAAELGKGVLLKKIFNSGHAVADTAATLRSVLTPPGVASAVVGTIDLQHLQDNAALVDQILEDS